MTSDLARPLSAIRGRNGHIKTTRPSDSLVYPRYERLDTSLKSCKWSEMINQSLWESVLGGYENWNMLNFDILPRHVKKFWCCSDFKTPEYLLFSAPVKYMSGNDPAPVHTEVRRRMMSRLRGSSWFGFWREQQTGNACNSCVTIHVCIRRHLLPAERSF